MANGYPIDDQNSGYDPQNPYVGRGSRFEHDIIHNGSEPYPGYKMDLYNQVQHADGTITLGGGDISYDGGSVRDGYTTTGTYGKKWMGDQWNTALDQVWPYIRMAELYLNYAEAAAEAGWAATDAHECKYTPLEALNKIRNRGGIADLPAEYQTPDRFLERVRNERRVELCFEDHRFFDIRRWKIGTTTDQHIYRVLITKLEGNYDTNMYPTGYRYEEDSNPVLRRTYEERHYLFPIKREDTYLGPLFKQNPGWE